MMFLIRVAFRIPSSRQTCTRIHQPRDLEQRPTRQLLNSQPMKHSTTFALLSGAVAAQAFVAPNAFHGSVTSLARTHSLRETGRPHYTGAQAAAVQQQHHGSNVVCMSAGGRTPFIAGNWKMNPLSLDEAKSLAKQVSSYRSGCCWSILLGVHVSITWVCALRVCAYG